MKRLPHQLLLGAVCALLASPVVAAGTVKVDWVAPATYTDAGTTRWDERDNLRELAQHLQRLGERHLRAGEELRIDVLDVDLAGWVRPSRSTGTDLRIVRGGADWPRFGLRYSLLVNGKLVKSGSETVADMDYSRRVGHLRGTEPLHHEKQMLERWFRATFVEQQAALN